MFLVWLRVLWAVQCFLQSATLYEHRTAFRFFKNGRKFAAHQKKCSHRKELGALFLSIANIHSTRKGSFRSSQQTTDASHYVYFQPLEHSVIFHGRLDCMNLVLNLGLNTPTSVSQKNTPSLFIHTCLTDFFKTVTLYHIEADHTPTPHSHVSAHTNTHLF